jgi:hypothetical protein
MLCGHCGASKGVAANQGFAELVASDRVFLRETFVGFEWFGRLRHRACSTASTSARSKVNRHKPSHAVSRADTYKPTTQNKDKPDRPPSIDHPPKWLSGHSAPFLDLRRVVSECPSPNRTCTFRYASGSPSVLVK